MYRRNHTEELANSSEGNLREERAIIAHSKFPKKTKHEQEQASCQKTFEGTKARRQTCSRLHGKSSKGEVSKNSPIACLEDSAGRCQTSTDEIHAILREYRSEYCQIPEEELEALKVENLSLEPHSPARGTKISMTELDHVLKKLQPQSHKASTVCTQSFSRTPTKLLRMLFSDPSTTYLRQVASYRNAKKVTVHIFIRKTAR